MTSQDLGSVCEIIEPCAPEILETLRQWTAKIENIKNKSFFDESFEGTNLGQDKLVRVLNWAN